MTYGPSKHLGSRYIRNESEINSFVKLYKFPLISLEEREKAIVDVVGVQWVSLVTENLLSHPFVVLRRQCQVYNASRRYHLHPFQLLPSIVHLHRRQGLTTLWKGVGSCLLVRGMTLAIDDFISKVTSWPKDVNSRTTLKRFGQHLLLKWYPLDTLISTILLFLFNSQHKYRPGGALLCSFSRRNGAE